LSTHGSNLNFILVIMSELKFFLWAFSGYAYSKNIVTKMQFHNFATSRLPCEI
jgi:hypothetical protein